MGKYPDPSEAKSNYVTGVQLAKEKYVQKSIAGADDFQTWFAGFASKIYPLIAGLPPKTGNVEEDVKNRVIPVARAIKELSQAYKATKLQEIAAKVVPLVRVR